MSDDVGPESDEVFLFINPKSGGQVGQFFLRIPQPFYVQLEDEDREVAVRIFDLEQGTPGDKPGFHALRVAAAGGVVRAIVGGGDGTVMWLVSEAVLHGMDPKTQLHIGIVPLGTGNDFSQALGWGGSNPDGEALLANDCARFCSLVRSWCAATAAPHDVWSVTLRVRDGDGLIIQKEEPLREEKGHGGLVRTKVMPMMLYCGVAKDAEVAYQVELRRTGSQICNKFVYALQGCRTALHWFCCRSQRVRRVISGFYSGTSSDAPPVFEYRSKSGEAPRLLSNPELLLCLNIDSFAAGKARNLWDNAFRLGVDMPIDPDLLEREQDAGDGRLEVVTLRRLARVVLPTNQWLGGRRIFQGAPLHLTFRQQKELITFFQVDGESFKLQNPLSVTIEHRQLISVLHTDVKPACSWPLCWRPPHEAPTDDSCSEGSDL